ncbi:ABC transporter permease [Marinobacterium nitratireducens]|nr:ABC transporter permease [Marinobacterium nitratireducens]
MNTQVKSETLSTDRTMPPEHSLRSSVALLLSRQAPLLTLLSFLLAWEFGCRLGAVPEYLLPAPSVILAAFTDVEAVRWLGHLWSTLRVALLGFLISIAVSLPLAVGMVRSRYLSRTLYPALVVIQSTPIVAVAPLIIVILGTGDAPRILITCLISFFPIVVAATTGMMSTPPELIELSRSLKARPSREIWQIRLPYAVPHLFSGFKVAITLSIIGAVVAEFVAAEQGLGYFVQFSTSYFKIPQAFAGLFFLSAVSLVLFKLVQFVQKRLFPWSLSEPKQH